MSWYERPYSRNRYGGGGFFENPLLWSPVVGRIFGIRIRVHMTFILFAGFELLRAASLGWFSLSLQYLGLLWLFVLLHEFGHCFAARYVGGSADEVLLWPLGGLAMVDHPRAPRPEFITVAGGPLVNVVLFAITGALLSMGAFGATGAPWNPFRGAWATWEWGDSWSNPYTWLRLTFQLNYGLFLFNMWPMYPMDAGRLLHCTLWPSLGFRRSTMVATSVGMVAAIVMGLWGMVQQQYVFVALAIMAYIACLEERRAVQMGEDEGFGGGFDVADDRPARRESWMARWRKRRADARRRREHAAIEAEQVEVDRILAKVHDHGIGSLTRAEKRTLEVATERERRRNAPTSGRR